MSDPKDTTVGAELQRLVGGRVRKRRNRLGLTRRKLAEKSHVSERYLAQLENGEGNSSLALLARVAQALTVTVAHLVRDREDASDEEALIGELVRGLSPEDRRTALSLLHRRFSQHATDHSRIALVGLRGAGKSTLGRALSSALSVPFVRLGAEVEKLAGMGVAEILELSGPSGYRRLEEQALVQTLAQGEACVVEAGGGIVTEERLLNLLLSTCLVVWIKAAPEEHMQRVINQGDLRPMADKEDAMSDLRRILSEREPLYGKAHLILDTAARKVEQSSGELCDMVRHAASLAAGPGSALKSPAEEVPA